MWIFGYGSLIWKPGFEFLEQRVGFVRGWERRFSQGSFDHRGVPGNPGRVVTLLPREEAITWGSAFLVDRVVREEILANLDHREKGGYQRFEVPVFDHGQGEPRVVVEEALMYVAMPGNPHYLGPASEWEIARQALHAVGPSGPNREYIHRLAESLRRFDVVDPHVFAIDEYLRRLAGDKGGGCSG